MENQRSGRALLWIIIVVALAVVVSAAIALSITFKPEKQMYMGRVKLMLTPPQQRTRVLSERETKALATNLVTLARSEKVLIEAGKTLRTLQVVGDPEQLVRTAKIELIPDSQVVKVEVQSPDYETAKMAADVMATEIETFYQQASGGKNGQVKVVDEAYASPVDQRRVERSRPGFIVSALGAMLLIGVAASKLISNGYSDTEGRHGGGTGLVLVALVALGSLAAALVLLFTGLKSSPRMYTARAKLTVTAKNGAILPDQRAMSQVTNLGVIATSEKVMLGAARELQHTGASDDPEWLLHKVKIEPIPESQIIGIEVVSPDTDEAVAAAEIIAKQAKAVYDETMGGKASEVKIIEKPYVSVSPNRTAKKLRPAGAVFAFGLCFLIGAGVGSLFGKRE